MLAAIQVSGWMNQSEIAGGVFVSGLLWAQPRSLRLSFLPGRESRPAHFGAGNMNEKSTEQIIIEILYRLTCRVRVEIAPKTQVSVADAVAVLNGKWGKNGR